MVVTKAGEALRDALDAKNPNRTMTQAELAKRLDVSQPSVSDWTRMNTRPEAHYRKAIDRELGIPEDWWMTDEELAIATGDAPPPPAGNDDASGSGEHTAVAPRRSRTNKPAA